MDSKNCLPCSDCGSSDVRVEPAWVGFDVYCAACLDYCPCGDCPLSRVAHGKTKADAIAWWNEQVTEGH